MINKTTELEIRQGKNDLKIAYKGSRPSCGALATVPLRDGYRSGALTMAAYIQASPSMHKLLCEISEHMYTHNHHARDCAIEATAFCTCGRDELVARSIQLIDQLERADEIQALGV